MSDCAVCDDARIKAIDAALDAHRAPKLVSYQFRLEPQKLQWHIAHRALEAVDAKSRRARQTSTGKGLRASVDEPRLDAPWPVGDSLNTLSGKGLQPMADERLDPKDQEQQFRTAWQAMDTSARQRNLAWLQDQLLGVDWGA